MENKIVFIDVDGTLVDNTNSVPLSAQDACKAARKNGHKLILSTGRSKPEIYKDILDIGFDGIIGGGGSFIELEEEIIMHETFPAELIKELKDFFKHNHLEYYLETNDGLYPSDNFKASTTKMFAKLFKGEDAIPQDYSEAFDKFFNTMTEGKTGEIENGVNKICVYTENGEAIEEMNEKFKSDIRFVPYHNPIFGSFSGEVTLPDINKANSIQILIDHLNIPVENTIAIGDGINDIEMFDFCNISVAMGNSVDALKAVADIITEDVNNEGFKKAFLDLKLI